jgi:hypothetical protein
MWFGSVGIDVLGRACDSRQCPIRHDTGGTPGANRTGLLDPHSVGGLMINFATLNLPPTMRFMAGPNMMPMTSGMVGRMQTGQVGMFNTMFGHATPLFMPFPMQPHPLLNFSPLFKGTSVVFAAPVPNVTAFGHPNALGLFL